jgi:hypothetical protein
MAKRYLHLLPVRLAERRIVRNRAGIHNGGSRPLVRRELSTKPRSANPLSRFNFSSHHLL